MSGIAGAVDLGGLPVEPGLLGAMADAIRHRGPDGLKVWHEGPAGLVHSHFWTTPEDVGEAQPLSSSDGRYWITADARIDNRDELIPDLRRAATLRSAAPSDGGLILAAFQAWGVDCAARLVGDFAFAIWDAHSRRLFAARDVIGLRQLCYAISENCIYFANRVGAVLCALPKQPELNRELIEDFLLNEYRRWVTETVYRGIRRLPPAHTLVASQAGTEIREYYRFGSQPPPCYSTDAQWIEAFRALLDEATRCRLRSNTPVGVLMGGLDSSSLACRAHAMLEAGADLPKVTLYSAVYDDTPGADEREYIAAVAAQCHGFEAKQIVSDSLWALRADEAGNGDLMDEPDIAAIRAHTLALLRAPAKDGCRVVLGGEGANQVLGHGVYYQPSALRGVPLRHLPQEIRYFKQASQKGWLSLLARAYTRPLLPEYLLRRLAALHGRGNWSPPWAKRDDGTTSAALFASAGVFSNPPGLTPSALVSYRTLRSPYDLGRHSWLHTLAAHAGVELRLPYLDRRVVDLLLHIPPHLRSWKGADRVVLREAMQGCIPEQVRVRRHKSHLHALFHRGLSNERHWIETVLLGSRAEALGFFDADKLRAGLCAFRQGRTAHWNYLFMPLSLEAWLRHGNLSRRTSTSNLATDDLLGGETHDRARENR